MPFPRFTRGSSGGLSFSTMNEVFDRIESLESPSTGKRHHRMTPGAFLGRIGAQKPNTSNQWAFSEVTYESSLLTLTFPVVEGGRQSSDGSDLFAFPAVGDNLVTGQVVLLFPMNRDSSTISGSQPDPLNGQLMFHALRIPSTSSIARVAAWTPIGTGVWRYSLQLCDATVTSGGILWVVQNGAATFSAYNGAEAVADAPSSYGVGSSPPGAVTTITRQPIKVGVVVETIQDRNGNWTFCVPNGYAVTC